MIGENKAFTLSTLQDEAICFEVESIGHDIRSTQFSRGGCCDTLTANDYKDPVIVCYTATRFASYKEALPTLRTSSGDLSQGGSEGLIVTRKANDEDKDPMVVCYGISAYESNSMKSSNPHSGIYEAKTSRTLDLNGGNPACNQGGVLVVIGRGHETDRV